MFILWIEIYKKKHIKSTFFIVVVVWNKKTKQWKRSQKQLKWWKWNNNNPLEKAIWKYKNYVDSNRNLGLTQNVTNSDVNFVVVVEVLVFGGK